MKKSNTNTSKSAKNLRKESVTIAIQEVNYSIARVGELCKDMKQNFRKIAKELAGQERMLKVIEKQLCL